MDTNLHEPEAKPNYVKVTVGRKVWLVPAGQLSDEFIAAVNKLNGAGQFEPVNWTEVEFVEFKRVCESPEIWTVNL